MLVFAFEDPKRLTDLLNTVPPIQPWHCPESFESEDIGKYGTILRF